MKSHVPSTNMLYGNTLRNHNVSNLWILRMFRSRCFLEIFENLSLSENKIKEMFLRLFINYIKSPNHVGGSKL